MQLRPIVVLSDPKVISHNINIKPFLQFISTEVIEIFICCFFMFRFDLGSFKSKGAWSIEICGCLQPSTSLLACQLKGWGEESWQ